MREPANPTDTELRRWAFSDEPWPMHDFDLIVAEIERVPVLVELTRSPSRDFFVHCLYLAIGDAVRTRFNTASRAAVKSALDSATTLAANDLVVARWIADSRKLLASPDRFEYEQWCGGGRATQVVDQPGC
jgi:hypothetical protein